jgi:hypothetical protein
MATLTAKKDIDIGEEIFVSYGSKSMQLFYSIYGFTDLDETCKLKVPINYQNVNEYVELSYSTLDTWEETVD